MKFRQRTIYLMVALLLGVFVQQSFAYVPSIQSKAITFSNVNATEMTINWVNGNGSNSIVLVGDNSMDVSSLGAGSATGTANANYSLGSTYGSTGGKIVYNGNLKTVTITGLTANTTYKIMVLSYNTNGGAWDINNNVSLLNPRTKTTLQNTLGVATNLNNDATTATTATISWTDALGAVAGYYLDVRAWEGAILSDYDLLDIGMPTNTKFYITGLQVNTSYQCRLRAYDAQGRVGAASDWLDINTLYTDPTPAINGSGTACSNIANLIATWDPSTGTAYDPDAQGTWRTLTTPSGAGMPNINPTNDFSNGSSTGNITVDTPGAYLFEYTISVGEYFASTTAGYTFSAPETYILTNATSTCGTYLALSATTTGCNTGVGTWSYFAPTGGTGSFGSISNPSTDFNLTGTPVYGNYTFRWTSDNGSFSNYDEIVVAFDAIPSASVSSASEQICGLNITLDGNAPVTGATGLWTMTAGPGSASFDDANQYNSSVTVTSAGAYSFVWTVSNTCSTATASKSVTFYNIPSVADAGNSTSTCGNEFTLSGNSPSYGTGTWTGPSGATFASPSIYNTNVTVDPIVGDYNEYTFTWSIGNGVCTPSSDEVTVTFYNQPIASVTNSSTENCGLSINLDGSTPNAGTGSWTLVSGNGTVSFDDATLNHTTAYVSQEGLYSFVWTVTNGPCSAEAGKSVMFYAPPTTANAGSDAGACGLDYTLSANTASYGTGAWIGPYGATFSSISDPNATVTVSTYGQYTFTWSIGNSTCASSNDDVTVTFFAYPTTASAGEDVNSCGTTATFAGNNPSSGIGTWTLVSGTGTANISSPNVYNSPFSVDTYGSYTFRWSISNGACSATTDDVVYNFYQSPTSEAGADKAICGLQTSLAATNPSVGTGSWSAPVGVTVSSPSAYNSSVSAGTYGTYTLTWTVSNGVCTPAEDMVTITFLKPVVADAGPDGSGCTVPPIEEWGYWMQAQLGNGETGTWSASPNNPGTSTFSDVNNPESGVDFSSHTGFYVFTWTVSNGTCTASDDIVVNVHSPIDIPDNATISGNPNPAAGTSNVQYSIPNYNNDLTYSWYYTPESSCGGTTPAIVDNGNNVIYLNYATTDCDGTLSVDITDLCGITHPYHLAINVTSEPVILGATLDTSNSYVDVTTNVPIYSTCSPLTTVSASQFQLLFTKGSGTATNATIASVVKQSGNVYRFNLNITGTPNGCETIEIKPKVGQVKNGDCSSPMPSNQTSGIINLKSKQIPTIASYLNIDTYARKANLSWAAPVGSKSLVVVACTTCTSNIPDPTNYTSYNANSAYGAQAYGTGYAVYNGSANSVTVTNLDPSTNYVVYIWTYTNACNNNNEYYNMTETTGTATTKSQATKLVFKTSPTKVTSGSPFSVTVQAQDDLNNAAYPGCDETLYITGSAALATATLTDTQTEVTVNNIVFNLADGDCDHVFTVDDDNTSCAYDLTAGTFTADVAPIEPTTHAKSLIFTNVQQNQITVQWTNGSGTGRLLAVRQGTTIPSSACVDGTDYSSVSTSSPTSFTAGFDMGSGIKGVLNTTTLNSATVTNLEKGKSYNFRVTEYNKPDCDVDWSMANFKNSGTAPLNPRSINTLGKLGTFNGVEIAYFDGTSYQLQVNLNWEAISEDGLAHYEIYRQDPNSEDMIKIGNANVNVSAGANSKYTITDSKGLVLGQTYVYRLVGVDFNGQTTDLAETLVTVNDNTNRNINLTIGSVNPNPVKDIVRFDVSTTQLSPVTIEIRDVEGKVIYTENRMINGTSTIEYRMNVKAAGSYFITVTSGDEGSVTSFIYQP